MDAKWFYDEKNPYHAANMLLQKNEWQNAEGKYREFLNEKRGTAYDQAMASINLASCRFAQQLAATHWTVFDSDEMSDIKKENKLTGLITSQKPGTEFIVRTNSLEIKDKVDFLGAIKKLKKTVQEKKVLVAVEKRLHSLFAGPVKEYGCTLIDENDADTYGGIHLHLMSLLGHLKILPHELAPDKAIYMPSNIALLSVKKTLDGLKKRDKKTRFLFVLLGENHQATFMGGKQVPVNPKSHGGHLNAGAFEKLMKDKSLVLIDCNPENSHIRFNKKDEAHLVMSSEFENRVVQLPNEEEAFDTVVALGLLANSGEYTYSGFGADNDSTAVLIHAFSKEAQEKFAIIIPNGNEYDVRMAGELEREKYYKHMLSSCRVYPCEKPEDQSGVIMQAYKDMIKIK